MTPERDQCLFMSVVVLGLGSEVTDPDRGPDGLHEIHGLTPDGIHARQCGEQQQAMCDPCSRWRQ